MNANITIIEETKPARECDCPRPNGDAITCIAEEHRMSRFNAMLTFAHGDIDRYPGQCTCPCHRGQQCRTLAAVHSEGAKRARRER